MAVNSLVLEAKVEELGEKCAQFTAKHGTDSPDLLMEYGRALFSLAKSNSSLVDSQKMDEKHLPLENPNVKVAQLDNEDEEEEEDFEEGAESEKVDESQENPEQEPKETDAVKVGTETEDAEESEQEDDFVAAFSVVDGARVLLERQLAQVVESGSQETDSKEADSEKTGSEDGEPIDQAIPTRSIKIKLSQARELLGDISLEDDNAGQAVEDYLEAVRLKRELFGDDSGPVSEAEFMLSLAYEATGDPSRSLQHLQAAATAAEAAKLPSAGELRQRTRDLQNELKQARKTGARDSQEAQRVTAESISGRAALASAVQSLVSGANDISQLTRKRKRPDDGKK